MNNIVMYINHNDRHRMCLMVKDINNLDTEDLIILILLTFLRSDLATATESVDR